MSINKHGEYFISPPGFYAWVKGKETHLSFCCLNKECAHQSMTFISIFFSSPSVFLFVFYHVNQCKIFSFYTSCVSNDDSVKKINQISRTLHT